MPPDKPALEKAKPERADVPNFGVDLHKLDAQRAADDLQALRDFPAAVKDLSASIREAPAKIGHELHLAQTCFKLGIVTGFALACVFCWLLCTIRNWLEGRHARAVSKEE